MKKLPTVKNWSSTNQVLRLLKAIDKKADFEFNGEWQLHVVTVNHKVVSTGKTLQQAVETFCKLYAS